MCVILKSLAFYIVIIKSIQLLVSPKLMYVQCWFVGFSFDKLCPTSDMFCTDVIHIITLTCNSDSDCTQTVQIINSKCTSLNADALLVRKYFAWHLMHSTKSTAILNMAFVLVSMCYVQSKTTKRNRFLHYGKMSFFKLMFFKQQVCSQKHCEVSS